MSFDDEFDVADGSSHESAHDSVGVEFDDVSEPPNLKKRRVRTRRQLAESCATLLCVFWQSGMPVKNAWA